MNGDLIGVYDFDEPTYHAHPALSFSGAKMLVPPSCPAKFAYEREHGRPDKPEYDLGHVAHMRVLGVGAEPFIVDADSWRTDKAKAEAKAARERGEVPLLPKDFDTVQAMAAALRADKTAMEVLDHSAANELSLFWTDAETGVPCRARPDSMTAVQLVDYKTTTDASDEAIRKHVYAYSYHQQADWYLGGAIALDLVPPDAEFRFVFQEKTPPYLVNVIDLDDDTLKIGRDRNRLALEVFRDCTDTGIWPGYSPGITRVSLPPWAQRAHYSEES